MSNSPSAKASKIPRAMSIVGLWRRVFGHLPGYLGVTILLMVVGTAAAIAESIGITLVVIFVYASLGLLESTEHMLGFVGTMIDQIRGAAHLGPIWLTGAILVVIILKSLLSVTNAFLESRMRHRIQYEVRHRLFAALMKKPFLELSRYDRGELLSVLATESYAVATAHSSLVRIGVNIGSIIVFGVFLLFASWEVALIAVIGALLHTRIMRTFSGRMRQLGSEAAEADKAMNLHVYMTLQGMRTVRAFGREASQEWDYDEFSKRSEMIGTKAEEISLLGQPISEFITLGILLTVLFVTTELSIPLSSVLAGLILIYRMQPHLRELDTHRLNLDNMQAALDAIETFMVHDETLAIKYGEEEYEGLKQEILFKDISHTYPGFQRPSLRNVTFHVPAGRRTAILGPSGSGKSTLLSLLVRLFPPTSGSILVDGVDIASYGRWSWNSHLAVAGQDVELVEGTVRENVVFVRDNVTDAEIQEAIDIAGLTDFVANLPLGYDEWLGDCGYNVSGGQRQRIGIARAIVRNPDILLLDEATSALDEVLDNQIRTALWRHFEGRTVIIVTHHLSIIDEVDHVVCMSNDGQMLEEGSPAELMKRPNSALRQLLRESGRGDGGVNPIARLG